MLLDIANTSSNNNHLSSHEKKVLLEKKIQKKIWESRPKSIY